MNHETESSPAVHRWIDALVRALDPGQEVCMEAELLKHFPFARTSEAAPTAPVLRMPATVHGAL